MIFGRFLCSVLWCEGFCWFLLTTHLRALHSSALGLLAEDLTPAAGAEVAACAVPHVAVVVHRALVQAAPLGGGAFIAALTGALHLGVALRETVWSVRLTQLNPTAPKVTMSTQNIGTKLSSLVVLDD